MVKVDWEKVNMMTVPMLGPSHKTYLKLQAGYTTKCGIICDLLSSFHMLSESSTDVQPILENDHVKVYPVIVQNYGTALKASLRYDERRKNVAGLTVELPTVKSL